MKLLFLESFYGGSHRYVADGLICHSRHKIDLVTLPDQNWSWRMHGAAFFFYEKIKDRISQYQGLIVTDLMNVADLKSLLGHTCPPILLYFHENQLAYPGGSNESRGFQYGFTDISSALAADHILFNSHTHRNLFLKLTDSTLNRMPDHHPGWITHTIESKSGVMYPGCSFPFIKKKTDIKDDKNPLIIWNHRWSYDKNPDHFFIILKELEDKGIHFRLALLGDHSGRIPEAFNKARDHYKSRIIQFGFASSAREYIHFLRQGSLVISTANQENFGISIIEAIRYGCLPLLPDRLSYPEILPAQYHNRYLYQNIRDAVKKSESILTRPDKHETDRDSLSSEMMNYSWKKLINRYDKLIDELVMMKCNR